MVQITWPTIVGFVTLAALIFPAGYTIGRIREAVNGHGEQLTEMWGRIERRDSSIDTKLESIRTQLAEHISANGRG